MEIRYTHPKSDATLVVTGTAEELAPVVLQLVSDLPVIPSNNKFKTTKTTTSTKLHSSSHKHKEYRKLVVADYLNNLTRDEICAKYPVSRTTINKWIRDAGLSTHSRRKSSKTAVRKPAQTAPLDLRQRIEGITLR